MVSSLGSIGFLVYGLAKRGFYDKMWVAGLIYYITFPILYEILLNIKALIKRSRLD